MAEEFSPEEKLLRLIRGEKKHKDKPASEKIGPLKGPAEAPPTPVDEVGSTKNRPRTAQVVAGEWSYFKFINLSLITILIITMGFFIFDIVNSNLKRSVIAPYFETQITNQQTQPTSHEPRRVNQEVQTAPFSTYAETIGKRELFKPLKSEVKTKKASKEKSELAYDKLKDLVLIGIIAGERPQVAIEDKKIKRTYFLYEGQTINQMRVEEILEDRVILDFEGEKFELTL